MKKRRQIFNRVYDFDMYLFSHYVNYGFLMDYEDFIVMEPIFSKLKKRRNYTILGTAERDLYMKFVYWFGLFILGLERRNPKVAKDKNIHDYFFRMDKLKTDWGYFLIGEKIL